MLFVTFVVFLQTESSSLCGGSGGSGGSGDSSDSGGSVTAVQAKAAPSAGDIPENYLALYQKAGAEWNIPWNILAGIGWVETHHGTLQAQGVHSGENFAGAGGPMQFLQPTFDRAAVDGDHDGATSRYDPADAIFSAAKLLKLHIYPGASDAELKSSTLTDAQIHQTIFSYNHSDVYVNDVLAAANRYAQGGYTTTSANYAGMECALGISAMSSSFGQSIADGAAYYARRDQGGPNPSRWVGRLIPYSWGGGDLDDGPSYGIQQGAYTKGFDCSGLAWHVVYMASGKKIVLPRTADAMYESNKGVKVPRDQLAPGDLVFFNGLSHMGIYWGVYQGKHWFVEAPDTGQFVKFSVLDGRSGYVGALRVTPPADMASPSPSSSDWVRAMPPLGAGTGGDVM
ncbi:hydrolase Nlp/P60 [Actinoallomurus iriomotensis]|uniref:Hydrolase Nlp/P60 n=2 Tax=Actinoallomurus iriomotensis TaxID=478107 RepID=A0A9W6W1C8_9ACTN|nr:hydrolase Nlp/P60 [Actinoallomurus iriomotensis]